VTKREISYQKSNSKFEVLGSTLKYLVFSPRVSLEDKCMMDLLEHKKHKKETNKKEIT
jgi:hypothetical protein